MPTTNGLKVSNQGMMMGSRDNFSRHYFVGGNTFMLDIFNRNKALLGVKANNFETTIARTRDMLKSAASVQITNAGTNGGALNFSVRVQNLSGHKLPGGYPARRAYLHVTVKDSAGSVVFESGKMNGASYLKDNRLLPAGFNKETAPSDVRPDATSLGDANFSAGSDDVSYQLSLASSGAFTVEVELNYQSLAYRYAQDLFADLGKHEYVDGFKSLYDGAQIRKETIASVSRRVN